jgi:adenylate cyclase
MTVGGTGAPVRVVVWAFHLALPLLGLWLLLAQPHLDVAWKHRPGHFGLVVVVATINVVLSVRMGEAARRRTDARIMLVSLVFLASAGFLLLHALATPGVLLPHQTAGFVAATPVGLFLGAVFALGSSARLSPERSAALLRRHAVLRGGLAVLLGAWAVASLSGLPPLGLPMHSEVSGPLGVVAGAGVVLYAVAAVRYFLMYRRRPAVMPISLVTAFTLLAEALVAVFVGRSWHASWWEWHLLMAAAFVFVAYSARVEYEREGSTAGLFDGLGLAHTAKEIREEYGAALESMVSAMRRCEQTGLTGVDLQSVIGRLAARFGLTERQTDVLVRAAEALAHERELTGRLAAMSAVGQDAQLAHGEQELLKRALGHLRAGFGPDHLRIGLVADGRLGYPTDLNTPSELEQPVEPDAGALVTLPLVVKERPAGVLEVRRRAGGFTPRDEAVLRSLASQLSIGLENVRLYSQLDGLFRQYMSPDVANALLADPSQAALGGAVVEVTALFADLRGFTSFSERSSPEAIVTMLNRYFGLATPHILGNGGTVVQFVGDALMALFNAPARQGDHALRAARAALGMQAAIDRIDAERPDWPRFRVGINTGPALVGNIGSDALRSFNAMGDAVNVAARLESMAEPGEIVLGADTYWAIRDVADATLLGEVQVKGRQQPVRAYTLNGLTETRAS